jgi:hypothetical protein
LFAQKERAKAEATEEAASVKDTASNAAVRILDAKRAQAVGILLGSLKLEIPAITAAILKFDAVRVLFLSIYLL